LVPGVVRGTKTQGHYLGGIAPKTASREPVVERGTEMILTIAGGILVAVAAMWLFNAALWVFNVLMEAWDNRFEV
jgi:hypothetical protein